MSNSKVPAMPERLLAALKPYVAGGFSQDACGIVRARLKRKYARMTVTVVLVPRDHRVWLLRWGCGSGWDAVSEDIGHARNTEASARLIPDRLTASFERRLKAS